VARVGITLAAEAGIMNTEKTETDNPKHSNGDPGIASRGLASGAKRVLSGFPSNLDAQIKLRPYATLGIAGAIGMGAGILLGSRILRSALASVASYMAVDLARKYFRQNAAPSHPTGPNRTQDAS
jgi:hypothetical protein